MASIAADKLRREIQVILKDADLNTLSSKKVRQMLETIFQCDFTERKKEIDDILMAEITTRDSAPPPTSSSTAADHDPEPSSPVEQQQQHPGKSDEELAMEIHQQENRPSLRRPVVSLRSLSFQTDLRRASTF